MAAVVGVIAHPAAAPAQVALRASRFLLAWLFATVAIAAPPAPAVQAEIDGLLGRLEASRCEFNRNGSWYPAAEAKTHLLRKLKYLQDRDMVQTTEQFIELAASGSSMSSQPYLVRCGSDVPIQSGKWLRSQLQLMRSAGRATRAP
jgi:hypothetical protein